MGLYVAHVLTASALTTVHEEHQLPASESAQTMVFQRDGRAMSRPSGDSRIDRPLRWPSTGSGGTYSTVGSHF